MTSEPGSAAMEQFEPLEKVFIRWARGADGSLNIRKWSQYPFDGATEYGDPVVLTRERDEASEALKNERERWTGIGSAVGLISDWLNEGTEDLPDETGVRVEIGKRAIIFDNLGNLRAVVTHGVILSDTSGVTGPSVAPDDGSAESASVIAQMRAALEGVDYLWNNGVLFTPNDQIEAIKAAVRTALAGGKQE